MKRLLWIMLAVLASAGVVNCTEKSDALRPRWMTHSLPVPKSSGYIFLAAQGKGATLDAARQAALVNLTTKLEHERGLTISSEIKRSSTATRTKDSRTQTSTQTYTFNCHERDKNITITARVVDEYWERNRGEYTVTELYTVNDNNAGAGTGSYNDNIKLTTSYGALPVVYSLIPGMGQFYKGSNLKGGLILGGAAICAAGIILSESTRHSYAVKRVEYPEHFDFYNKKVKNWEIGRNVAVGVGAALYVYNLIDAAVAPGRRKVKVSRATSPHYSFMPYASDNQFGVTMAVNF